MVSIKEKVFYSLLYSLQKIYTLFPTKIVLDILFIIEYLLSFVAKAVDVDVDVVVLTTFVLFCIFLFNLVDDVVAASFISASFVIASIVFVSLVVNCLSLLTKSKH